MLCGALVLAVMVTEQPAIVITIVLPGWYPALCVAGAVAGLYLVVEHHQVAIRGWIDRFQSWLATE